MNKGVLYFFIAVAAVGVIAAGAFLASIYYQGGSGEASEAISAPALSLDEPTEEAAGAMAEAEPAAADTSADTEAEGERRLYRITQAESEARFTIDELLFGNPKTVIGTTDQVAGDVIIDFGNPANSEIGPIRINARTLTTDNEFRNRAIRSVILESAEDAYEYIDFTPTALEGLPTSGALGETYAFTITGDLKIREITRQVTFDASVTLASEDRLEGTAETVVNRADFELQIPANVPNVSDVAEEVPLFIDFVALPVAE
ncbi:MAG: YceI family protein [Anaerolineae bacterium]|nr:YceI family protein [Anaerolineae bacterium]